MEQPMMKDGLSRRLAGVQLALMIVMAAILAVISYMAFRNTYIHFYNEKAQDIVRIIAAQTDWEQIEHFAATGEPDEYSESLTEFYNNAKANFTGIDFLYLFIPGEHSFTYIIEARTPGDDPETLAQWGNVFKYTEYEYEKLLPDVRAGRPSKDIMYMEADNGPGLEAWAPVFDADGTVRAMVEADYLLPNIESEINAFVMRFILVILLCVAVALEVMLVYMRRNVSQPAGRLNASVDGYEHGELNLDLNEYAKDDEFRHLATSFRDMTQRIEAYHREVAIVTAEKERIGAELNVAAQIQADMLPRIFPAFPNRREFDIYASMTPAKEVGGDFYDFFLVDDDHLALVMADVSGKGVPAALFMVIAKTLIKNRTQTGECSPMKVLMNVNEQLCKGNEAELFVTVWLAILEISTGKGIAANAGHEHPVLRRAGGSYELVKYRHSPAVATMEGIRFREHEFQLNPGDSLFVYTDGVAEATNANNELYGLKRMLAALNEHPEAAPEETLATLKLSVDEFVGDAPQFDDITMLCLKYYGPDGAKQEGS